MRSRVLLSAAIALLMAAGSVGAWIVTPTKRVADNAAPVKLDRIVPASFGEWRVDENVVPVQVDPTLQAQIDKIYADTLSRTYVNAQGERVMLVIAYGSEQSDSMGVHKPDVCYPAQGFEIVKNRDAVLDTGFGSVPVKQLVARQPSRYEPITYWVRVGDAVDGSGLQRKLTQLKYGMAGQIPDGMLFRVSSLGADNEAFALQRDFTQALLTSMDASGRAFVLGKPRREL